MSKKKELKICKECGVESSITYKIQLSYESGRERLYIVCCNTCGAFDSFKLPNHLEQNDIQDKALETWNKLNTNLEKCPWPDHAGNELHEGDMIKHPSGEIGIIEYNPELETLHRKWSVNYGDNSLALLGIQLSDRGQAVKVDLK